MVWRRNALIGLVMAGLSVSASARSTELPAAPGAGVADIPVT